MRILLANYRYFVSGGPERYMFNVTDALVGRGHEVIPFSVRYTRNQPTPYSHYFVEPLAGPGEVYFREHKPTAKSLWRTLSRLFYATDVEKAVTRLVKDTKPELAYILCYLRKLSPSLLVAAKRAGLPIVVRLSDYALLCPQAHFLRNNVPCELCIGGNLMPSVRYRCVQNSLAASAVNALASQYHQAMHFFDLVDSFVTPSRFMHERMVAAGYPEQRLCYVPTFVNSSVFRPDPEAPKEKYVAYVGRLDQEKGVHVLIEAFAMLQAGGRGTNLGLQIAGTGDGTYVDSIRRQARRLDCGESIRFLGDLATEPLARLLNHAFLSVVPSLWYENLPNAILESYACGTPVLASNLGSLAEFVDEGRTGYLFHAGDANHLTERLAVCLDQPRNVAEMGRNARKAAETTYSRERHLDRLEALFGELRRPEGSRAARAVS